MLGLPNTTHNRLLHLICNDFNVDVQLYCRVLNFLVSCSKNPSDNVQICFKLALGGSRSAMSKSWGHIRRFFNLDDLQNVVIDRIKSCFFSCDNETDLSLAGLIRDMLYMYHSSKDSDLMDIIHTICTM